MPATRRGGATIGPEVPYLVIGAGASGLSAARVLARRGIPFEGVERHGDVGGIWDIDNPGTPVYETAHLISSKTLSALAGHPFPDDYPDYPDHRQVLAYLRGFADTYDLRRHFRFRTAVERIEPDGDGWTATLREVGGDEVETRRYAGVVMSSGNFWTPNLPDYLGDWHGEAVHSQDHRSLDRFRGRSVLIVGAGNTGCDLATDAAVVADRAAISMRRGYRVVPKHIFGKPTDVFAHTGPPLSGRLEQKAFNKLLDVVVGDQTRYGLPEPDHDVLASHPILNTQMLDRLAHGDLEVRPDIEELRGDTVRFVDGTEEPYDLIVWATGYRVAFPYLDRDHFDWRRNDPDLFVNVASRDDDALFALGILEVDAGAFPIISLQAELIGQVIHDLRHDPRQADAFRQLKRTRPDLSGGVEHVDSPRHDYYVQDRAYRAYLRRLLDRMAAGELSADGVPVDTVEQLEEWARDLVGSARRWVERVRS